MPFIRRDLSRAITRLLRDSERGLLAARDPLAAVRGGIGEDSPATRPLLVTESYIDAGIHLWATSAAWPYGAGSNGAVLGAVDTSTLEARNASGCYVVIGDNGSGLQSSRDLQNAANVGSRAHFDITMGVTVSWTPGDNKVFCRRKVVIEVPSVLAAAAVSLSTGKYLYVASVSGGYLKVSRYGITLLQTGDIELDQAVAIITKQYSYNLICWAQFSPGIAVYLLVSTCFPAPDYHMGSAWRQLTSSLTSTTRFALVNHSFTNPSPVDDAEQTWIAKRPIARIAALGLTETTFWVEAEYKRQRVLGRDVFVESLIGTEVFNCDPNSNPQVESFEATYTAKATGSYPTHTEQSLTLRVYANSNVVWQREVYKKTFKVAGATGVFYANSSRVNTYSPSDCLGSTVDLFPQTYDSIQEWLPQVGSWLRPGIDLWTSTVTGSIAAVSGCAEPSGMAVYERVHGTTVATLSLLSDAGSEEAANSVESPVADAEAFWNTSTDPWTLTRNAINLFLSGPSVVADRDGRRVAAAGGIGPVMTANFGGVESLCAPVGGEGFTAGVDAIAAPRLGVS